MHLSPRRLAWVFVGLALLGGWAATLRAAAAPVLSGQVNTAGGAPLAGATVFVYTAGPKTGTSPFCPSCYPDCGKSARSDAAGQFAITGLSTELVFRLLVVAPGYAPRFMPGVEPGAARVEIALTPRKHTDVPLEQTARGRVLDPRGVPIFGAVITLNGVALDDRRQRYGGMGEMDALVVTDEAGEFTLTTPERIVAMLGIASARGYANQHVRLATGQTHALTLTEGATLTGRILLDGQPLPRIALGVSPQDRSSATYVGSFEIGTDAEGRFSLPNLPPRTDYFLFGKIETLSQFGTLAPRRVHVGADHSTTDLGDLKVSTARHRLNGRVVLSDGQPLPPQTRLMVGRDQVSDVTTVEVSPDGAFEVTGLPAEAITLSLRVPGYIASSKNESIDAHGARLTGRIEGDITGFVFLLEPGKLGTITLPPPLSRPPVKAEDLPRNRPLRGAEAATK